MKINELLIRGKNENLHENRENSNPVNISFGIDLRHRAGNRAETASANSQFRA
jgi:hypothetical protein